MQNQPEKLDVFGSDENMELREEIQQRANKRAARYAQVPAQQSQVCARVHVVSQVYGGLHM